MVVKKGKVFERETAALAGVSSKGIPHGQRIPSSGAIGTTYGVPQLAGDARWFVKDWLGSDIHIECKHGYSDKGQERKSMRIEREWFDKHMTQAKAFDFYPAFAFKFKFTQQNGMSKMILFPFPVMERILSSVFSMNERIIELEREVVMWEKGIKVREE